MKIKLLSIKKNKLISNYCSLSILQALNLLLPLLTIPYLLRVLGVSNFGLVVFAQSFIYYFAILLDYGFDYSATREIAINKKNKNIVTEIFSVVMQIKMLFIVISFLVMSLIINYFDRFNSNINLYYVTFIYLIGNAMFPVWYFLGHEDMKFVTYINVIAKGIFTICIFIFINKSDDYIYVPLLNGLGYIIAGTASLLLIHKKYKQTFKFCKLKTITKYLKDSTGYFFSRLSVSMFTTSNVFVLGMFVDMITVGYFSVAEKLYNAVRGFYGPVSTTLYPYISKTKDVQFYKKVFKVEHFQISIAPLMLQ